MRVRILLIRGQDLVRENVLGPGIAIIGRDPSCDVVVDDIAVSKRHLQIELSDAGLFLQDVGSLNGVRVNGRAVQGVRLKHLDVVQIGSHKIHVLEEALMPEGGPDEETTVRGSDAASLDRTVPVNALPLEDTQPGTASLPKEPVYALKRVDEDGSDVAVLEDLRTVVGAPGRAALIVKRRNKLQVTKLSRLSLSVNGQEVGGASFPVEVGDVIEVGAVRYQLVRVG